MKKGQHLPEAFPIERAKDWIERWKDAGGGFFCHPQPTGEVMVQLAYQAGETESGQPEDPQVTLDRVTPVQAELMADPDLKSAVTTLVADAWNDARIKAGLAAAEVAGHA